jgi:predicted Zn-dependent peptidase
MVEHMLFKGTPTRSALDIAEAAENVGGRMNAYTSRDITAYYIHILKEDVDMAVSLLSDMIQNSTFPEDELAKERDVILQEIGMVADAPDDLVFDLYQMTAYRNQAVGAPILGTEETVSSIPKQALHDYVARFYTPSRLVVSAAGNLDHDDFVAKVRDAFAALPQDQKADPLPIADYTGGSHTEIKELEQTHIVVGYQAPSRHAPSYRAASLLASIMGGGMASRLFQEVREKRGLVYSVFATYQSLSDGGQFMIYAGTGAEKVPEFMSVLESEIQKIIKDGVTIDELNRVKTQAKASLLMGRESMMTRVNQQAKYMINHNEVLDIEKLRTEIESITIENVQHVAQQIFATQRTICSVGADLKQAIKQ